MKNLRNFVNFWGFGAKNLGIFVNFLNFRAENSRFLSKNRFCLPKNSHFKDKK